MVTEIIIAAITMHAPIINPLELFFIKKPYQIPDSLWTQLRAFFDVFLKN